MTQHHSHSSLTTFKRDRDRTAIERFTAAIKIVGTCWEWQNYLNDDGYGRFRGDKAKKILTHRFSYQLFIGPIPKGLTLDHGCRNRRCSNPIHLKPKTHKENILIGEGIAAQKAKQVTRIRGHELQWQTVNSYGKSVTRRFCPTCTRKRRRRQK